MWRIFLKFHFTRIIISAWEGLNVLDKIKYVCAYLDCLCRSYDRPGHKFGAAVVVS